MDSLFIGFCLNICAHFKIIRSLTFKEDFNYIYFIKCHQEIIELCHDLNEIYVSVIFTQFLESSMLLCGIGFQLVMVLIFKVVNPLSNEINQLFFRLQISTKSYCC